MRYIDADKLIAEIRKHLIPTILDRDYDEWEKGKDAGLQQAIDIAESLQQEQPVKYETALEKAREWMPNVNQGGHAILIDIFPELGEGLDPRYGGRKQEQPEVDLEREIQEHIKECLDVKFPTTDIELIKKDVAYTARKFYELGLNAKKEE